MKAPALPKKKEDIARVIRAHCDSERCRYSFRRAMWLLALAYFKGQRHFTTFNTETGQVIGHFQDKSGRQEFQSHELLSLIDKTAARIASMDLRPQVERTGTSIQQTRERAVNQIVLDSLVQTSQLDKIKPQFAHIFTSLGCCGLSGHVIDRSTMGLVGALEVVHPKEVFPYPALHQDYTKENGRVRERSVTLDWLKGEFGTQVFSDKNKNKMEYWQMNWASVDLENDQSEVGLMVRRAFTNEPLSSGSHGGVSSNENDDVEVVRIRELWLDSDVGTCDRYVLTSGDLLIHDEDLSQGNYWCPLGWARFMESGCFYGMGLFDILFSVNRMAEKLMKNAFNNVMEADKYGIVGLPMAMASERVVLRDVGQGLRAFSFQTDPLSENQKPIVIQPFNTGDVPGRTAQFAREFMQSLTPIQDLIAEKGRVDSAAGLQFLDEQITKALTTPTMGIEQCFGGVYRHMTSGFNRAMMKNPQSIPITSYDLNLAGVVMDQVEGKIQFTRNPLPDHSKLRYGVRQASPRTEIARKQAALGLFQAKLTDRDGFILYMLQEGIDIEMYVEPEKAAWQSVVSNILTLFGDGVESQKISASPYGSRPDLQLRVLTGFMTSPVFQQASPDVLTQFEGYRQQLMMWSGLTLPNAVPNPEDLAIMGMNTADAGQGNPPAAAQPQGGDEASDTNS